MAFVLAKQFECKKNHFKVTKCKPLNDKTIEKCPICSCELIEIPDKK